jgi:Co/Zn/Cd efflux system component
LQDADGAYQRVDVHTDYDDHKEPENINVRAAFIHVVGGAFCLHNCCFDLHCAISSAVADAVQTVGVMIAAGLIW